MSTGLLKFSIIPFLFFCMCGCSSTRLAYNYADWLIAWKLDDYIDLNREQDELFEQQLASFLIWHRKDQLPQYITFVDQFQIDVTGPLTVELLKQHTEKIQNFWCNIMVQAEPEISRILLRLQQDQKQELFENISRNHAALEKKYLGVSSEKRKQRRIKITEKVIKRFVGKLTPAQKMGLERWSDKLIPSERLWLENRQAWQTSLQKLLNGNESESYRREQLRRLLVESESFWSREYRTTIEKNKSTTFSLLVTLYAQLNQKQKKHLQKELEQLKSDLVCLANN